MMTFTHSKSPSLIPLAAASGCVNNPAVNKQAHVPAIKNVSLFAFFLITVLRFLKCLLQLFL